jgi:basic amino acid/polyamine antiporter, APA family
MHSPPEPKPSLSVIDAVMLIAGVVIGAGIFALPSLVAANTATPEKFLLAWVMGGAVSLAGALCYAELATAYPDSGGEHHFLRRAFGAPIGFLFAWSRLAVLQTGSIAIQAYIVGDYLARWLPAVGFASEWIAALAVVFITAVNVLGIRHGKWTQVVLGLATCLGVLMVAAAGLFGPAAATAAVETGAATSALANPAFGLAMVFVLLAFGGWNEAAYVSADVSRRNMVRALMWGIGTITVIYLLVNVAYLRGLGMTGLAGSKAVAAELVQRVAGAELAAITSMAIAIAALSTMNATTITGGRSHFALGRDVPMFRALGRADEKRNTPRNALLVQGAITLVLVVLGAFTRDGFVAMIEYTAPVFWFFFFLVGVSLFVLRARDPQRTRPFRVPLYPLTPLIFCGVCLYMIRSSLAYTGLGALVGAAVLLAGLPLLWFARTRTPVAPVLKQKEIHP